MRIAVVLGHRINDDGSLTDTMYQRLDLMLELNDKIKVDKIVVSGGVANKNVSYSEAFKMKEYLVSKGLDSDFIIMEDKSMSTKENAENTIKMFENETLDEIIIVSTFNHFTTWKALDYFNDAIKNSEKIAKQNTRICVYTNHE